MIKAKNEWVNSKTESLNVKDSREFWKRYKCIFGSQTTKHINSLTDGTESFTTDNYK